MATPQSAIAFDPHTARTQLAQARAQLADAFRRTQDADGYLAQHAACVDALVAQALGAQIPPGVAVLAVGGYGRCELYPFSDVDLLFLYDAGHEASAAECASALFYRLWDVGLSLSQAHRSVEECLALAQADMSVRTALLDRRRIAGDEVLFAHFGERFERELVQESGLAFVEAKLAERDRRHQRFGDSRYMLEPNVKEGKGGLRDVHTLWWLVRYTRPIAGPHGFAAAGVLSPDEAALFEQARQFLSRVRIHLHLLAARAEDRLTFDHQQALAGPMGFSHPEPHRAVARFMRRYFVAVRTIGSMTRVVCALLEDDKKRKPRTKLGWLAPAGWALGPFKLEGERLDVKHEAVFVQEPVAMLELFAHAQAHELDIHPHALRLLGRALHKVDDALRRDARANQLFLDILLSPKGAEPTLKRMSEAGLLGRFLPDFGRIIGQTQFNMYHVYTVDEHTLVALGMLHALKAGALRETVPLASEVIQRIDNPRVLHLALLCHDIAKGRGGDHSELGERIAGRLAQRFGFAPDEADTTAWLVRNHLLLSHTAFKRDINDPKTLSDFVGAVQQPQRLKLLLVLTVADMCAVRPGVWNAWKGALMRDLYHRALQAMGMHEAPVQESAQLKTQLVRQLTGWEAREIEAYLALGSPAYWASLDAPRHAAIARMVREAGAMAWPLLIDTQHHYERSMTEIIICAFDQQGLFSRLAGAMALAGANIASAKIFTLKNGLAVDVFQLQDAAGEVFDRPDRLARMSVYIEQVLHGELDLAEAFGKNPRASRGIAHSEGRVYIDNDASNIHSVIEVTGRDRSGFLYRVTRALSELGLSIATAHISTYGTQVADVFYVKDAFGMKITHPAKLEQVRSGVAEAVEG